MSTNITNPLLFFANEYLERGWSVIPLAGKQPNIAWKEFQTRFATKEELESWFSNPKVTGIGIVTGKISSLIVLDLDEGSTYPTENLPKTGIVVTGGNGYHYYFEYDYILELKNKAGFYKNTDIRAEGGYVVAPPSIHPDTNLEYKWLSNDRISFLPYNLFTELTTPLKVKVKNSSKFNLFQGVSEGERNQAATSVIGKLISVHNPNDWEDIVWELAKGWNTRNEPPLSEDELRNVFDSICKRELEKRQDFNHIEVIPLDELLNNDYGIDQWIIEGLIPKYSIACLAGVPKVGKSFLSLQIAQSVAQGTPLFDQLATQQNNVLVISKEDYAGLIQKRLKDMSVSSDLPIHFITDEHIFFDNQDIVDFLINEVSNKQIGLVIIDSFRRVLHGDENSSQVISPIHTAFKSLIARGATILFIHHIGKAIPGELGNIYRGRGSSDITALVDSMIYADKESDGYIQIRPVALRHEKAFPFFEVKVPSFQDDDNQFTFGGYLSESQKEPTIVEQICEAILTVLTSKEKLYQNELIKEVQAVSTEFKNSTIKNAVNIMMRRKLITPKKQGKLLFLSLANDDESTSQSINSSDSLTNAQEAGGQDVE